MWADSGLSGDVQTDIAAYAARKLLLKDGAIISDIRQQPQLQEAS